METFTFYVTPYPDAEGDELHLSSMQAETTWLLGYVTTFINCKC
jgi:hypothetical protein